MKKLLSILVIAALYHINVAAQCRVDSSLIYNVTPGTTNKTLKGRAFYTYNNQGKITEQRTQIWTGTYYFDYLINQYFFNANNQIEKIAYGYVDTATNTIVPLEQRLYNYNSNNLLDFELYQSYNETTNTWTDIERINYTYTGNLLTESIKQKFNGISVALENFEKYNFTYFSNDSLNTKTRHEWDDVTATWLRDKRWRHSYNSNDTLTQINIEAYSTSMSWWMELTEKTLVYNTNKQLVAIHENDLNIPATVGIDSFYYHQGKLEKHINYHLDIRDILIPNTYLGYEFNANLDTIASIYAGDWDTTMNLYDYTTRLEHYCAESTSIPDIALDEKKFNIYPNPIKQNQLLRIESKDKETITVYNQLGQALQQWQINKGMNELIITNLKPGLYYLNSNHSSQKIIIQP